MTKKKTIRISEVKKRLAEKGITFYAQGWTVIRSSYSPEQRAHFLQRLHHSVQSCNQAVAAEAWRVILVSEERLSDRWMREYQGGCESAWRLEVSDE